MRKLGWTAVAATVLCAAAVILSQDSHGNPVDGYNDTPRLPGQKWRVHDMDRPRPPKVTPGPLVSLPPPSDAIILFDGTDLSAWQTLTDDGVAPPAWKVENGYMEVTHGDLATKQKFGDLQLHIEWMVPKGLPGVGQDKGNSGVKLMGRYEIQVLESYENLTYADGQAAALYGQWPPLVNASRPPGEWNVYDIMFEAPRFGEDGKLVEPAYATVLHDGVLVHDHRAFIGTTVHGQVAVYTPHGAEGPLTLQDHDNPVRYRNIWVRRIRGYDTGAN